jgi:exoribonuclease II
METLIGVNSLVLYRGKPARVRTVSDRLEIEVESGETIKVRVKDVELLHPGPLKALSELKPLPGEMRAAWEILVGSTTSLAEMAELAFGAWTPASAWAAWQFVVDGLYFNGKPDAVKAASEEELAARVAEREGQAREEQAWKGFLERMKSGSREAGDERYLKEVEQLAYAATARSRVLRELGRNETPENAHALLLETGYWTRAVNPVPRRLGLAIKPPDLPVPALPDEERRDLTHLTAYAIDDVGSDIPDDAVGLEGERIWVHIADVAALAPMDSALDVEARGRAETLHLPEEHIHLFPPAMTARLGLGLQEITPALSFGIDLDEDGGVAAVEVTPAWVRVTRLTYESANELMDTQPFAALEQKTLLRKRRRELMGAVNIDLPEVNIHVTDEQVEIRPIPTLRSREMVQEAMILAGDAIAGYASRHGIAIAYSNQEAPDTRVPFETLAGMFAMRKYLRRSQYRVEPGPHSGLGLAAYTQATSPLRRYLDLVAHQQLRAFLRGERLLTTAEVLERIGSVEAAIPPLRQAELRSEKHWTLVYLQDRAERIWQGVLVDKRGREASGTVLIPELALEVRVHLPGVVELDQTLNLRLTGIDLPNLEAYFRVESVEAMT